MVHVAMDMVFAQSGTLFHGIGNYSFPYISHLARHPEIELLYFQPKYNELSRTDFITKLSHFIVQNQVQILHLQSPMQVPFPEVFWSGELPPVRITATVYDIIPLLFPDIYFKLIDRAMYDKQMDMLRHCHHLLAISEHTRRDFMKIGFPHEHITNVGTGTMDGYYPEYEVNLQDFVHCFSIDTPYVLAFVPNDFRKNAVRLVQAFSKIVRETGYPVQLVFIGHYTHEVRKRLETLANQNGAQGKVRFTGHVSNVQLRHLYHSAHALVMPTQYEGLGLPALEAMQCHTPVLTSCTSSMPEVVGEAAVYVDPLDEASISQGIHSILFDETLRKDLKRRAEEQVSSLKWDVTVNRTMNIYKQLLGDE